jgi:hypothetical protein
MVGTLQGIVREEGLRRLYRGLTPACLRHCVYSGIRVGAYEFLREKVFLREADGSFPLWKVSSPPLPPLSPFVFLDTFPQRVWRGATPIPCDCRQPQRVVAPFMAYTQFPRA